MAYTKRLNYEAIRSIDSATFTGSYQALGTATTNPSAIVKIVNNSNKDVTVSINGTSDHDFVPTGGFTLYDCTANLPHGTDAIFLPSGTQFYVKGSAGTGLVYLVVLYIIQV